MSLLYCWKLLPKTFSVDTSLMKIYLEKKKGFHIIKKEIKDSKLRLFFLCIWVKHVRLRISLLTLI